MTSALLRRNSSKQGLQNLLRLTAQWSVEDEEEAARERRRRERERQLRSQAEEGLVSTSTSSESGLIPQESQIDGKPAGTSELEEDEGFSDWSLKLEQRKQRWAEMGEAAPNGYRTCYGECTEAQQVTSTTWEGRSPKHSCEEDGNLMEAEAKLEQVQLGQDSPTFIRFTPGPSSFLKFVSTSVSQEQPEAELEGQQKLIETACVGEENQDMAEVFPEVQEEIKHEEEEEKQEEKKRRWKEEEEAPEKRQRAPSTSSNEEEGELPLSPTLKITDRTECLNRSIQKSNSVKKTQPPLPVAKIDDKLEQYTHAIETSSKTPKPVRQLSIDLPANSAAVTSTKNLWETGEVVQSPVKTTPCKDIVAGDIVSKRSIWEQKESPNADGSAKVKLPGKKYRYVAIGHGKYKKVLIEDETSAEK
ncbi:lymphocyte-specific protein 1 isoform X3 [Anolis carolinensis]|uniref:Lymphocyte specific protein 1 n=1 Tax=Anolis carolinensis TaxID=28377 RepID=G1KJ37_ANOCA|nr:PREDICTED: lymphocyte-specific protein 1 isoform X2 [Anolis carolinensis]|eukprot:XP_008106251.1 PREDICTED: lymphocyte-specific protein 1 isoform X2 [Anolis carolinensis]